MNNRDFVRSGSAWTASAGLISAGDITNQSVFLIDGLAGAAQYEVTVNLSSASTANDVGMRLSAGGSANAAFLYDKQGTYATGGSSGGAESLAAGLWGTLVTAPRTQKTLLLSCLNLGRTEPTVIDVAASGMNATSNFVRADSTLRHRAATAFDGIYLIATTGTFSGWYEVRSS